MADKKIKVTKPANPNGSVDIVVRPKIPEVPPPPPSKSTFTKEVAIQICAELSEGKSLRSIVGRDDMPAMSTVFLWLSDNEWFSEQYARAKLESADALADDIQNIGDKTLSGFYDPAAARVAIDAYKWTASKLKPKKYGDKVDITSDGEKLGVTLSAEQSEQLIRARAKRADLQGDSE